MNQEERSAAQTPVAEALAEGTGSTSYTWVAPGNTLKIQIEFDVVDDINFEAMRGFGASPRRGVEVGGILIGQVLDGGRVVTITGFLAVPCKHSSGPSYILTDGELPPLAEALAELRAAQGPDVRAVGFFRSNTRDTLILSEEDQSLLDSFFPGDPGICLMVRPFATRVSEATFFLRRDRSWTSGGVESVFPFRRRELGGGKRPRRPRPAPETAKSVLEAASASYLLETPFLPAARLAPRPETPPSDLADALSIPIPTLPEFAENRPSRLHGTWVWIPLSFIFLLLGIVLGFQISLSVSRSQRVAERQPDPYTFDLKVVESGDSLHLMWNKSLPAFKSARSGFLHVRDGKNTSTVEITPDDIARGGILYRNATQEVRFLLEIAQRQRSLISESIEVRLAKPPRRDVKRR